MMRDLGLVLLAMLLVAGLLTGCERGRLMPGGPALPPGGYWDLCARQPEHFACRPS